MKITVLSSIFIFSSRLQSLLAQQPHEYRTARSQVEMIIKSLFRRQERWNPVHPTIGAFWGVGIGIGCGIGWGPGFGHEVVGYVGAGCGVGFNVGITLFGAGIGFPANYLFTTPHSVLVAKKGSLDGSPTGNRSIMEASFSGFKIGSMKQNIGDLPDVRSMLDSHAKHMSDCLQRVSGGLFPQDKGLKSRVEEP